jgi:SGNH hydrolase-like domain, acetyltransferase AlgX
MIKLSERLFLALIIVTFLLPASLTLWIRWANPQQPQFDWIANRTLYGVTVEKKVPPASLSSWQNGELQKGLNSLAGDNFAGRELLIRIYNQVLYRAFRKSYMYLELIISGKHGNLFEHNCVLACDGFQEPIPSAEAEAQVVMMRYLSERLKELRSSFVFLIAPSKVTMYPEEIPDRYLQKIKSGERKPTNYDVLVPLLQRYHIPYVDGRETTSRHKDAFAVRAFPKTGIHWTRAVAFFTTDALLKTIGQESGHEMPQLLESVEGIDQRPDYTDDDLFNLLNLIEKPNQRYLHPNFQIPEGWPRRIGTLTFVGSSFTSAVLKILDSAQVFERMNQYNYFTISRVQYPGQTVSAVNENAIPWEKDFWNTRAVVLEANEESLGGRHIPAFLMAALAELQQEKPQERDTNGPPQPLSWGFGTGENGNALAKKGFAVPERQLTWITSLDAEIELPSPGKNVDLQLIIEAMPPAADGIAQRVVSVEANGSLIGSFAVVDPAVQFYSLPIKAAANSGSSLKLHFSFSPAAGSASENRSPQLGMWRLALVPMNGPASEETGQNHATVMNRVGEASRFARPQTREERR